ncbi:MAG: porphobilinogen synthase [Gammaproteobacteria bacterium]|nr:porphobilinogen synthase [Gammaproteobacteria bacterium]NND37667.1 porphobilinogen synthase [Gammaproteobacteria bacterium]
MAPLSLRRTRQGQLLRELTREVRPHHEQFIQPLFVVDGIGSRQPVTGLHDVYRDTPSTMIEQIEADLRAGINKFLLFGVPAEKRPTAFEHDFTARQITAIKDRFGDDVFLAVDVCLCSHTTHGHCGILNASGDQVVNDATVESLTAAALRYAEAGADCVAPSDMMDGRIGAIRRSLTEAGRDRTVIMSYAAKFHSSFYGPFRIAADSAPATGNPLRDRATYQIDPARPRDALLSARRDDTEGADILMVKPGLPYLDVLARLSREIVKPWAVYQTSGEQAAIDLLSDRDLMRRDAAQLETWIAFRRAGASIIISYAARRAREVLSQ